MSATYETLSEQAINLVKLLNEPLPSSLIRYHPNDILKSPISDQSSLHDLNRPKEWDCWWDWASEDVSWVEIATAFQGTLSSSTQPDTPSRREIPRELCDLMEQVNSLILPRDPYDWGSDVEMKRHPPKRTNIGMSPKKSHEVSRMSSYIIELSVRISKLLGRNVKHIVDVGAGQGHLSRALHEIPLMCHNEVQVSSGPIHVLALDSSPSRVNGAKNRVERFDKKSKSSSEGCRLGTLTFRSLCVGNDSLANINSGEVPERTGELLDDVDAWIQDTQEGSTDKTQLSKQEPVILVGLHTCGSLTPAIFRSMLSKMGPRGQRDHDTKNQWEVIATIVVGCCYNLIDSKDFPLSDIVKNAISGLAPPFTISDNHLQLSAQVPSQWLRSEEITSKTIRKVVFRALIQPNLRDMNGGVWQSLRLGKLHDSAYADFDAFLDVASKKSGLDLTHLRVAATGALEELSGRLEVLHTLRCMLGPAVESLLLLDRILWLKEKLVEVGAEVDARLVNLFHQGMDSGRNVGIVVAPVDSFP